MCGITGVMNRPTEERELQAMTDRLTHRGPDERGFYLDADQNVGLGHQRLSIIDLSTGSQPMTNEDGSVQVVYNGEIYNYQTLKTDLDKRGHTFQSTSDTEVLAHGYEEYGADFIERLNGMFAFALWDRRRNKLLVARDRVGIKPLYYYRDPSTEEFVFASEIKAILESDGYDRKINQDALGKVMTFQYVPGAETCFEEIEELPPGHYMEVTPDGISQTQYWDLEFNSELSGDYRDNVEQFRGLFDDAVGRQMMSDVPYGSFLSGGIDSSAICAAAAERTDEALDTFTVGYPEEPDYDELPYARAVGDHIQANMHTISQSPEKFHETIDDIVWHQEQPTARVSALPRYIVSELASESVKMVLSGDGGDELFVGYPRFLMGQLQSQLFTEPMSFLGNFLRFFREWGARKSLSHLIRIHKSPKQFYYSLLSFFNDRKRRQLLKPGFNDTLSDSYFHAIEPYFDNSGRNFVEQLLYLDFKTYLPSVLDVVDKITMAHSLEARVPILDNRIIEFSTKLPVDQKTRHMRTKSFLSDAFRPSLPDRIFNTGKRGFSTPFELWFRDDLEGYLRDVLFQSNSFISDAFEMSRVETMVDQHTSGRRNHTTRLWRLLNLQLWHQQYF